VDPIPFMTMDDGSDGASVSGVALPERSWSHVEKEMEKLLTIEQVCDMLTVKKSFIYSLTHVGGIPHYKVGRHLRFRESEILEWLKEKRREESTDGNGLLAGR
jgi:excisionase family DNA binding protein